MKIRTLLKVLFVMNSFKLAFTAFTLTVFMASCVPSKKYNELVEREKTCSEELAKYKKMSMDYESLAKDLELKFDLANKGLIKLRKETSALGEKLRLLNRDYNIIKTQAIELENSFNTLKN